MQTGIPGFRDRLRIRRLATHARLRALRPGWALTTGMARELAFVPSELQTADPSFLDELRSGAFGLDGIAVETGRISPFALTGTPLAWQRDLHGFSWLRHLRAAGDQDAVERARDLVTDWTRRSRSRSPEGVAGEPGVTARRVTSWVTNSGFLLEGAAPEFYRPFSTACRTRCSCSLASVVAVPAGRIGCPVVLPCCLPAWR